jgi:hypothetical protein
MTKKLYYGCDNADSSNRRNDEILSALSVLLMMIANQPNCSIDPCDVLYYERLTMYKKELQKRFI